MLHNSLYLRQKLDLKVVRTCTACSIFLFTIYGEFSLMAPKVGRYSILNELFNLLESDEMVLLQ